MQSEVVLRGLECHTAINEFIIETSEGESVMISV